MNREPVYPEHDEVLVTLPMQAKEPIDASEYVSEYVPGFTLLKIYRPVVDVTLVRDIPVAVLSKVTVTPGGRFSTHDIAVNTDGPTVGLLSLDPIGIVIDSTSTFNGATLINVPEPGALSLLVMGLSGMLLAGRGRRSELG